MMVNDVILEFPGGLIWVGGGVFLCGRYISWMNKKLRDGQGQKEKEHRPEG